MKFPLLVPCLKVIALVDTTSMGSLPRYGLIYSDGSMDSKELYVLNKG